MIRKAIIVVLTLGAVSVTAMSVMSYSSQIQYEKVWLTDKDHYFLFRCNAGQVKLFWIEMEKGRSLSLIDFSDNNDEVPVLKINPNRLLILDRIVPRYLPRVRWRTQLSVQPFSCRKTQIQIWAWLVVAAFAAYPMLAFAWARLRRWRRRRKGLCLKCGYDLTGNETSVCSECGEQVES